MIEKTESYIAESVEAGGTGRALRDAHAKGYGLVRGQVEILDGLPPEYAQGIYATPGTHDALIRFSNGSPHAGADARLGGATGLALKIFDIPGPTLLEDEPETGTFDYANINAPIFFCNTVEHYLFIQDLFLNAPAYFSQGRPGAHRFFTDFVTGKGTLDQDNWAWDEFLAFLRVSKTPPANVLLSSYWTMGAVRHGDYIAKVRITPEPSSAAAVVRRTLDPAGLGSGGLPAGPASRTAGAALRLRHPGPTLHRPGAHAGGGHHLGVARAALAARHRGQAAAAAAGHLRPGKLGEDGRAVLHALAGHRRACPPGQHHAGPQGGLPAILHRAPQAQPTAAHRAPQRRRGTRPGPMKSTDVTASSDHNP
ncbi:hypothetical protein [Streptomyces sp. NBC_00154]|uniref:hypothetical protein n=1 Tax=Streptomyces sp. NBC_00154 TaxID=2975670 RepID=UPI0022565E39|nr:hypothetical protein [Streptomyces sp. NBC_00154]MCX5317629.1 hypothetical protein [Streptomyces sp. NBC_00154]